MLVLIVLVGVIIYVQYTKEDTVTATVHSITTQQRVNGTDGNVSTSYSYLVGTSKGTMKIQPDGIMSSTAFGRLEEGKTYRLHTRGFSFPLFGMYPYIVDAKKEE